MSALQDRQRTLDDDAATVAEVDYTITHPFAMARRHRPLTVTGDDLLSRSWPALQRIALPLGITVPPPTPAERERADLTAWAGRAGLILREVTLPDRWWRHDYGPLLAATTDGEPVALLRSRGRYRIERAATAGPGNPAAASTPMNRRTAAQLGSPVQAKAVTPQLPDPITSPWDLARYAVRGNTGWMMLAFLVSVVGGLLTMTAPLASKAVWDTAVPQANRDLLWGIVMFLLAASVGGMALKIVDKFATLRVGTRYESFVHPAVWWRVLHLPSRYFREHTVGELSQQAALVPSLFGLTLEPLFAAVGMLTFGLPALAMMLWFSATLTVVGVLAVGVQVGVSILFAWRLSRFVKPQMEVGAAITSTTHDLLQGMLTLRVNGAEARGLRRWSLPLRQHQQLTVRMRHLQIAEAAFGLGWPVVVTISIYAVTGTKLLGTIAIGDFLAFMTAFGFFKGATRKIVKIAGVRLVLPKVWARCEPLLTAPLERHPDSIDPGRLAGRIDLRGVSFGYDPGRPVLHEIDLQIPAGSFVAVTGPSGAGKSSLIRVLLGLDPPTAGLVAFDNIDLSRLDPDAVRSQFGVVTQDMHPVADVLRSVLSDDPDTPDDRLWAALDQVDMADQVRDLPMGLETVVAAGGSSFSGGEIQRILLARAFVRDPAVLILDEGTSALDAAAQDRVMQSVAAMKATRIVVAHRLSTITQADRIIVLGGGRIVQDGSYDELKDAPGLLAELIADQLPAA